MYELLRPMETFEQMSYQINAKCKAKELKSMAPDSSDLLVSVSAAICLQ